METAMKSKSFERFGIAILVFVFILAALWLTSADTGLTWDEPDYIAAAKAYTGWFDQVTTYPEIGFKEKMIDYYWQVNSEHPPLDKIWSGAVWVLARNITDDLTAHRMGNMLLSAALAGLLYLWVRDQYGLAAGLAAVAALFSMPRLFFHAHLAALDVPAAFSVFITTFLFWKTLDRKHWAWGLLLGLVWGLALATKINAIFAPLALGVWVLIFRRQVRLILRLVIMGISALPVFFISWPWLYNDTLAKLKEYIGFITDDHHPIGQYYLGNYYMPPPWHFGIVMLLVVLPLGLTLLYLAGMARSARWKRDQGLGIFFIIAAFIPFVVFSSGESLVYDNDRFYMASYPYLAGLAAIGLKWLLSAWGGFAQRFGQPIRRAGSAALVGLAFLPQLIGMVQLYPHYLSYYSEAVGGLAGATRLGLESTYWCETYKLALPILNEQAQPGDIVWVEPWSHNVMLYYQRAGFLRDDIRIATEKGAPDLLGVGQWMAIGYSKSSVDWWVFQHRQTMLGPQGSKHPILAELARHEPVYQYAIDGVPIFTLYK